MTPSLADASKANLIITIRLGHAYIVFYYDYWRDPGGAYLVMRSLHGDIRHRCQDHVVAGHPVA